MTIKTKFFLGGLGTGLLIGAAITAGVFMYMNSGEDDAADQKDGKGDGKEKDAGSGKQKDKADEGKEDKDNYVQKKPPASQTSGSGNDKFPLRLGSKGPKVKRVQVWLLRNFGLGGQVNGVYDQATADRVSRALKVNEVDHNTFDRLGMGKPIHQQPAFR